MVQEEGKRDEWMEQRAFRVVEIILYDTVKVYI